MKRETDLNILLKTMKPRLNPGEYVFCSRGNMAGINQDDALMMFREDEGITIVLAKEKADHSGLGYSFVASWITLTVHSSLDAVGMTAAFSKALSANGISCNVVAAYYHDHIFVRKEDAEQAMKILNTFAG